MLCHALLLLIEFDVIGLSGKSENTLSVEVVFEQEQKPEEQDALKERVIEQQVIEEQVVSEPPESVPEPIVEPTPVLETLITKQPSNEEPSSKTTVTVPISPYSSDLRRFIQNDAKLNATDNGVKVSSFGQTFIEPAAPVIEDVARDTGPLGGGNYKVRRNGVECQTLRMVPQSFDELSGTVSTINTSGECEDLKPKIQLTNKDGSIKNSAQYAE